MARVKRGVVAHARHKKVLEQAKGFWGRQVFEGQFSHGRRFTKEEIWENYTYFIKQVVPVAEAAGVRIGIHPDDPPAPVAQGALG